MKALAGAFGIPESMRLIGGRIFIVKFLTEIFEKRLTFIVSGRII